MNKLQVMEIGEDGKGKRKTKEKQAFIYFNQMKKDNLN